MKQAGTQLSRRGFFGAIVAVVAAAKAPIPKPVKPLTITRTMSYGALDDLVRVLEAGSTDSLVKGQALQIEDLSPVMLNVTYRTKHVQLARRMVWR